jgi:hypothetical protein
MYYRKRIVRTGIVEDHQQTKISEPKRFIFVDISPDFLNQRFRFGCLVIVAQIPFPSQNAYRPLSKISAKVCEPMNKLETMIMLASETRFIDPLRSDERNAFRLAKVCAPPRAALPLRQSLFPRQMLARRRCRQSPKLRQ